jgi:hypothetical protein
VRPSSFLQHEDRPLVPLPSHRLTFLQVWALAHPAGQTKADRRQLSPVTPASGSFVLTLIGHWLEAGWTCSRSVCRYTGRHRNSESLGALLCAPVGGWACESGRLALWPETMANAGAKSLTSDDINYLVYRYLQESGRPDGSNSTC